MRTNSNAQLGEPHTEEEPQRKTKTKKIHTNECVISLQVCDLFVRALLIHSPCEATSMCALGIRIPPVRWMDDGRGGGDLREGGAADEAEEVNGGDNTPDASGLVAPAAPAAAGVWQEEARRNSYSQCSR